jgi:hypothetical protein
MTSRRLVWWWVRTLALALVAPAAARAAGGELELGLSAQRLEWRLGERIELRVSLTNVSGSTLEPDIPDVSIGRMRLFVAPDRGEFREYLGPRGGVGEGADRLALPLQPGEESSVTVALLWNHRVPTEHLSALYADRIRTLRIDEYLAIAAPGRYWLKAVYAVGEERMESEAVAVDVGAPEPADVPIWERMQRDGELTYLVHTGELHWPAGSAAADAFAAEVRQLTAENPGSRYAAEIERLLASFEQAPR